MFYIKQTNKVVPTGNCEIWNFLTSALVYNAIKSLIKASKLSEILKILRFEGEWEELWAKIWFYSQSLTKHLAKSKKMKFCKKKFCCFLFGS